MKKTLSLILSLTFVSTILLGCQSGDNTIKDTDKTKLEQQTEVVSKTDTDKVETNQQSEEDNEKLKLVGEISKVSISKSKGNDTTVFNDDKSIETFNTIFTSAVKEWGIVNMSNPEFYIDVVYSNENKQSFNLWVGKKGEKSTLMRTDDTHTIYTVSEEMTDKLIDLIQ